MFGELEHFAIEMKWYHAAVTVSNHTFLEVLMRTMSARLVSSLLAVFMLMSGAGSAMAADTWLPDFDASKRVHVSPTTSGMVNPDEISKTNSELESRSSAIQFYLVITRKGDDQSPNPKHFAEWKLNQLIQKWQAQPGFPQQNHVIILVVYGKTSGWSAAGAGGSMLQTPYGLNGTWVTDEINKHAATFMPSDPGPLAVAVSKDFASAVSGYDFRHNTLPWLIALGVIALVSVGGVVFAFIRRSAASALITKYDDLNIKCASWYEALEGGNLGFLRDYDTWAKQFGAGSENEDADGDGKADGPNETLVKFTGARRTFWDIAKRKLALSALVQRGEAATKQASLMLWGAVGAAVFSGVLTAAFVALGSSGLALLAVVVLVGSAVAAGVAVLRFSTVVKLFTVEQVKVTGKILPEDQQTLAGSDHEEHHYTASELVNNYEKLAKDTGVILKSIKDAFAKTKQNADAIRGSLVAVDTLKKELTQRNLPFTPYEGRYAELGRRCTAVLKVVNRNPVGAEAESELLKDGAGKLASDMQRACAIVDALKGTDDKVRAAHALVDTARATAVNLQYPFVKEEPRPTVDAATKFALLETDGNPDTLVSKADSELQAARDAVTVGKLNEADQHKLQSEQAAAKAEGIVLSVKEAKAHVESQLGGLRTNVTGLNGELPAADTALSGLKASFIAGNYKGEPEKVTTAHGASTSAPSKLDAIREAYHGQRFLAARSELDTFNQTVTAARSGLAEVHARLAKLKELRSHAKSVSAQAHALAASLVGKLEQNEFTTAEATDTKFHTLQPVSTALALTVKGSEGVDWVAKAQEADELLRDLTAIDNAIDQQKAAHAGAKSAQEKFQRAIEQAEDEISNADTRETSMRKFEAAKEGSRDCKRKLKVARTDWAALTAEIGQKDNLVDSALTSARADKAAAQAARKAIDEANDAIRNAAGKDFEDRYTVGDSRHTFGTGVRANTTTARSYLASARESLAQKEYGTAKTSAERAVEAAATAVSTAQNSVNSAVSEARRDYEDRQQRIRDAAIAAAVILSSTNNNSGGGGGGGGYQGGGGGGGGGGSESQPDNNPRIGGAQSDDFQ